MDIKPIGTVLALDLGTRMGWAFGLPGAVVSGTVDLSPSRFESAGMRFIKLLGFLTKLHEAHPVTLIVVEEVRRHIGTTAAHVYGGLLGHMQSWAEQRNIPYTSRSVGTIKLHATGKGNASKNAVMQAMEARGYSPKDDNEADALALLHCYLENILP